MDASGSYDPDTSGDYYPAPRMTCWKSSGNGTWFFYDARGNKLINGISTDGWYTGADGQWRQELGMACFAPGIYRSFYVNENTENEKWEFSVYTSMSWEEWTLHGPSDKREDQFVREKISRTVLYFRTMRLINVCIGIQTFIICPSVLQLPQRSSLPSSQDLHQSRNERSS